MKGYKLADVSAVKSWVRATKEGSAIDFSFFPYRPGFAFDRNACSTLRQCTFNTETTFPDWTNVEPKAYLARQDALRLAAEIVRT